MFYRSIKKAIEEFQSLKEEVKDLVALGVTPPDVILHVRDTNVTWVLDDIEFDEDSWAVVGTRGYDGGTQKPFKIVVCAYDIVLIEYEYHDHDSAQKVLPADKKEESV